MFRPLSNPSKRNITDLNLPNRGSLLTLVEPLQSNFVPLAIYRNVTSIHLNLPCRGFLSATQLEPLLIDLKKCRHRSRDPFEIRNPAYALLAFLSCRAAKAYKSLSTPQGPSSGPRSSP